MDRSRILAATLVTAVACTAGSPRPATATRVTIPALRCVLEVPAGTVVTLDDDGATFTARPGARIPRTFSVHARPAAPAGEVRRSLARDVSVTYSVRTDEGGSGGEESVLRGALQVGERSFAVTCRDQAEPPGDPEPTWCLAWLATIRVDDR